MPHQNMGTGREIFRNVRVHLLLAGRSRSPGEGTAFQTGEVQGGISSSRRERLREELARQTESRAINEFGS